ncbi:MAG: ribosome small subunit-dependent GTPase A [Selenomonadaceae bacterium]|nr:ribosome small subunit-dependent GTPase A [Selenomonadaceae bacterium]
MEKRKGEAMTGSIGTVIRTQNSFYYIVPQLDGDRFEITDKPPISCKLRGVFKKNREIVTIGDKVEYTLLPDGSGVIEKLLPRRSLMRRPMVANIDKAFLVFAAKEPDPHPLLVDRFLVLAEWSGIKEVTICFNKIDLVDEDVLLQLKERYERIGYEVLLLSAINSANIDELRNKLIDSISVFAGPSGVGKSSLGNAIDGELDLATGGLSDKIQRGKHTTRLARLMPVKVGGYIVDTPGFSSLDLTEIEPVELAGYFPEFRKHISDCRYRGCLHQHERTSDCGVKSAVETGEIDNIRYTSYLSILNDINEQLEKNKKYKWRKSNG